MFWVKESAAVFNTKSFINQKHKLIFVSISAKIESAPYNIADMAYKLFHPTSCFLSYNLNKMPTFAVVPIPEFETQQRVNKLIRNGKCMFDEFWNEILVDRNLSSELYEIFAILEDVANNKLLPQNRYRKLHLGKKLHYNPFEIKSKHLRIYLFHEKSTGQILVIGGKKGGQDEDIDRLEKIIKEYTIYQQTKK